MSHVRVATVVNIARAVEELKELGVWTVGLDADATDAYDAVDYTVPTAFVLGAEGEGLRRLVRERCDRLVGNPDGGTRGESRMSRFRPESLFLKRSGSGEPAQGPGQRLKKEARARIIMRG